MFQSFQHADPGGEDQIDHTYLNAAEGFAYDREV